MPDFHPVARGVEEELTTRVCRENQLGSGNPQIIHFLVPASLCEIRKLHGPGSRAPAAEVGPGGVEDLDPGYPCEDLLGRPTDPLRVAQVAGALEYDLT